MATTGALALVVMATSTSACRGRDRAEISALDAHEGADATSAPFLRCPGPVGAKAPPGTPGRTTLNSDGTRKRLPPSAPSEPGHALVLRYDDFGPQAMAGQLLGADWWSWEPGGSFEPGDAFDVRVVVYRDRPPAEVVARYPTIRGESDHRLVERAAALRFLDVQLAELRAMSAADDGSDFGRLAEQLRQTRRTIVECLGE